MPTVSMDMVPVGPTALEDYVAALFQSSGHFVEKNVTERDQTEILELDAVATSYDSGAPVSIVVEAKSGDWGFADLFKLSGWLRYLELDRGVFFAIRPKDSIATTDVNARVSRLGVTVIELGDFQDAEERFSSSGFPPVLDSTLFEIFRWSFWIERVLIKCVRQQRRNGTCIEGANAILRYHMLVNDGIFFARSAFERAQLLYEAYQDHPKLALGVAREIAGEAFVPEGDAASNAVIAEALQQGAHDHLQACLYVEHRARLALLKAAVDCALASEEERAGNAGVREILAMLLPATFRAGLNQLRGRPYFSRYPIFWQTFMWAFGGIVIDDQSETEFATLAHLTGLPVDCVPQALEAFDLLFPIPGGWFVTPGRTRCRILKMMPMAFQGLGALHRLQRFGLSDYRDLGHSDYTDTDLIRWHNSMVTLLTGPHA